MSKKFYASLVGPFLGYYALIEEAEDHNEAALMCNTDRRMKSLWCSIYTESKTDELIEKYGGQKIELCKNGLNYDVRALWDYRTSMQEQQEKANA